MATTFDVPPRLRRLPGSGPLAGVAAGIAKHAGLRPLAVRIGFVLGGIPGAVLYAVFWVVLPADVESADTPEQRRGLVLALLLFAGGVALLATQLGLLSLGPFVLPAAAIAVGVALVWRQSDREQRRHWVSTVTTSRRGDLLRLAGGVVLVVAGLAGFLALRGDLRATRDGLLASVLLLGGVAVLALPWILAQADEARRERRQRIRVEERAEVAAHLHDSVLQTLVLIQKAADDPRQVARLARSHERALRGWLFGQEPAAGGLRAGLELAAADVEASFGVSVEVVAVGDCPGSERVDAVVAAAREAMVNAAKHSGAQTVQVFAEAGAEDMSVFVRDRGVGFDASTVPADRLGISRSVHARIERQGGVAEIRSTPGEGAEVRLVMPRG
jgi:signal transduction histidine kinase